MRILSRFGFLAPVIGVLLVASSPTAKAGLLNINLAQFHDTDTGYDGEGILGGGLWNRINFQDAAKANPLVKADGSYTRAYLTETGLGNPAGATQDGNDLQDESWGNHQQENPADREIPVEVTVFRLIPGQVYKVAVYSDRIGSESEFPDTYTVNGVTKPLPKPGDGDDIPLPGVLRWMEAAFNEGEEYEKIPRLLPYAVLPLSMALLLFRFIQAAWAMWTGRIDRIVASHEVEDEVADVREQTGEKA